MNTGAFAGHRNPEETIFKTNLEAAQAICRQLRLRNLGGIIIIDFIDMEAAEHRDAVLIEFRRALEKDHTKMTVNGFTALGLVEMTRNVITSYSIHYTKLYEVREPGFLLLQGEDPVRFQQSRHDGEPVFVEIGCE